MEPRLNRSFDRSINVISLHGSVAVVYRPNISFIYCVKRTRAPAEISAC